MKSFAIKLSKMHVKFIVHEHETQETCKYIMPTSKGTTFVTVFFSVSYNRNIIAKNTKDSITSRYNDFIYIIMYNHRNYEHFRSLIHKSVHWFISLGVDSLVSGITKQNCFEEIYASCLSCVSVQSFLWGFYTCKDVWCLGFHC